MKTSFRIFLSLILLSICAFTADARRVPGDKVGAKFETTVYDFGNIPADTKEIVYEFIFTNTGEKSLAILAAKPSCGCTEPVYDRKPLEPGQTGKIKVTYHPDGHAGEVSKDIRVNMRNGAKRSEQITLRITGVLLPTDKK